MFYRGRPPPATRPSNPNSMPILLPRRFCSQLVKPNPYKFLLKRTIKRDEPEIAPPPRQIKAQARARTTNSGLEELYGAAPAGARYKYRVWAQGQHLGSRIAEDSIPEGPQFQVLRVGRHPAKATCSTRLRVLAAVAVQSLLLPGRPATRRALTALIRRVSLRSRAA